MSRLNRRVFLRTSAAASAVFPLFTIAGTKASGKILGSNDVVRIGVAGINGRGAEHINQFASMKDASQVTYLIDPDSSLFESRSKQVKEKGGNDPKCVQDIREALDDKNLDAVSVATCNHWHSLIGIWACQAGKDAYIEKPISHNLYEGRKLVEAARRHNRVVQHGTQQRSDATRAQQMAAIQSGKYGKLLVSKGYCCKPRWSIGFKPTGSPPAHLDFNLWLGPAAQQPYHANLVHYNWHWFWETGNGDTGNQGVHEMDVARWAIALSTLPNRVWSLGGRFVPDAADGKDQGETPNMQLSVYEYGDVLVVFETRGLVANKSFAKSPPFKVGNEFYTTEGVIRDWKFYPKAGGEPQPVTLDKEPPVIPGGPFGSFATAVRTRNLTGINGDVETAHYSAALCHLGNISYRLGEPVPFNRRANSLGDNAEIVSAFDAIKENLQAVDVKLDDVTYQLGRTLTLDPKTERFVGDEEANRLLTRSYRAPFVVPETV